MPPTPEPWAQENTKRVACIRCRSQKLKCIRSTHPEVSNQCNRCRKANTECNYAAAKPLGRPRIGNSQRPNGTRTPEVPSQAMTPPDIPGLQFEKEITTTPIDHQDFDFFFGDMGVLLGSCDTSMGRDAVKAASDIDGFTPASSSQGSTNFPNDFTPYMIGVSTEVLSPSPQIEPKINANMYVPGTRRDLRQIMQQFADLGLTLFSHMEKYQKIDTDFPMSELAGDVLRSSTDYLNLLMSLDPSFLPSQPTSSWGSWSAHAQPGKSHDPLLEMSAGFQLLIPYVRLVQLHDTLYKKILDNVAGNRTPGGDLTPSFPEIWVGNICIKGRGFFQSRILLHINVQVLAEIEAVLDLPWEARVCYKEAESGAAAAASAMEQEDTRGIMRRVVSPRLLKMILDERNQSCADVQSMRQRIAQLQCLP
ncbi:hypothetical protein BS50DRAFT_574858 [Corynespora cassiicola Philippines]|uniref:Zn(2)-C6 fungal-type domain-containing protein n=1 Tax=Corynespora cassiicola Philippines TaxID=1448308 RepID=A0A2T2NMZ5_CORCC|nr:hypothetical protein BS50DRAFT_574858 [Corynespora cassiicola Philippines]